LGSLREFSFEFEVKSARVDRMEALAEIGVTHARYGLQTFSPAYRDLFHLTATLEQIRAATERMRAVFPYISCDILYGMNGQTEEELLQDVEEACGLGIRNLDFYPINNLVTQPELHKSFRLENKPTLSSLTKYYMRLVLREALREKGFLPHNGHGWVRVPPEEIARDPVVTDSYSFVYHEHMLGYPDYDLLGFGTNAASSFANFCVFNPASRDAYVQSLSDGHLPVKVTEHEHAVDACRPLALALPYHGSVTRDAVDWDNVPEEIHRRLEDLAEHGLIINAQEEIQLTRSGWEWYTSLMYFLAPIQEQRAIRSVVRRAARDPRREIEGSGMEGLHFIKQAAIA
jgi:oxygen-independent coproporphyrinogen-3 oxidase